MAADWFAVDRETCQLTRPTQATTKAGHPGRGEIYLTALDPTLGCEIHKTRPALIIKNDISNRLNEMSLDTYPNRLLFVTCAASALLLASSVGVATFLNRQQERTDVLQLPDQHGRQDADRGERRPNQSPELHLNLRHE